MIDTTAERPAANRFCILQQNINKARSFTDHYINANMHHSYDLICFQEPWLDKNNNLRATTRWRVIYPTTRRPSRPTFRATSLVNVNINTNSYSQIPFNSSGVTVVQLRGGETPHERWTCTVINVYNNGESQETLNKINRFISSSLPHGHNNHLVLLGDFNQHHAMWESDANSQLTTRAHELHAQPLIDILAEHSLVMTLPQGVHTLKLKSNHMVITRPDNVFCLARLADTLIQCEVNHHQRGPGADHYPITTVVEIPVDRVEETM